jgi:DNA-directed RNA polymerase subunit F
MSEETPVETPVETPTQEAPQTEAAPAETPEVNLDQKVTVDGQTYSVSEMAEKLQENKALQDYQQAASNLMKNQTEELTTQRESDLRYVMSYEGYTTEQIEQYVDQLKSAGQPMEQQPTQPEQPQEDPRVNELNQRLSQVEERERQLRLEALQSKLDNAVSSVTSQDSLSAISNAFKRVHGDEGHSERMKVIGEDVQRETLSQLRKVRSAGGEIDDSTIRTASETAAKSVAERYRTVIGDPDKLGRAPETASGQTQFYQKKPVELPKFEPGKDTTGTVYDKARKFAEDSLLDIAADVSTGGNSKL